METSSESQSSTAEKAIPAVKEEKASSNQDGPLRDHMIDLATRFLTNSRVQSSPMEHRRAFLKKKGLTDNEIEKAIQIAQKEGALLPASNQGIAGLPPPPLPPRPVAPPPRQRTWSEYAVMAAVVGGVGYAVVYFVKHYLIPWFQSPRVQEQRLESVQSSVDQLRSSVTEVVADVHQSTQAIRDLLSEQQQHLQLLSTQLSALQTSVSQQQANGVTMKEVKDELGSLKGLLLSRHQFPPTPSRQSSQGGIPAWQRVQLQPSSGTPSEQKPPQQNGLNPSVSTSSTESSLAADRELSSGTASGVNIENPAGVSSHAPGQQAVQIRTNSGEEWHDAD